MASTAELVLTDLERDAVELLQRLIRYDTVNPPGNERAAMEHLRDVLAAAGLQCELLADDPERPNLVARLPGRADGPRLGLLGHVDTVLADPSDWTYDPWSADIADGHVWGRGAVDMKSQVAAQVAAAAALARSGWRPPRGELVVMCVVDEETGGGRGARWLVDEHPDAVRCDMLINEGGGGRLEWDGRRHYTLGCAEKGVFRFRLIADGAAGHASMPRIADNALLKFAPVLDAFARRRPPLRPTLEPRALIEALGMDPADPAGALEAVSARDPSLTAVLEATLGVTFAPTRVSASDKVNVIPSRAVLEVDCRVPPGLGEEDVRVALAEVLGADHGLRVEFAEGVPGNRSPARSDLREAIDAWLGEHDPGTTTVPSVLPGFTDSRQFRRAFPDAVAYGFFPHRHMTMQELSALMHSADERVDIRDVAFAARFYHDLPQMVLA